MQQHIQSDLADRPAPANHPADLVPGAPFAHRPLALSGLPCSLGDTNGLGQVEGAQDCAGVTHGRATLNRAPQPAVRGLSAIGHVLHLSRADVLVEAPTPFSKCQSVSNPDVMGTTWISKCQVAKAQT